MKKEQKSEAQIAAEKAEAEELAARILGATNTIPKKVLNETDFYGAQTFKNLAIAARKVAAGKQQNLGKLRDAWRSIQSYYA